MHNFTSSAFVAALERVKAIREGRCAPVVTYNDGDQSRVTPGSMEAAILGYQLTVGLDHNPCYPYMSPWMKVTYCGDYATVCQLVAGKTEEQVRQLLNTRESLKRRGALHHAVVGALALCGDDPNTERYRQEVAAVMPVKNDHIKIVLKLISLEPKSTCRILLAKLLFTSVSVLQQSFPLTVASRSPRRCCGQEQTPTSRIDLATLLCWRPLSAKSSA